ncbi:MAG TPA: hypothetical protein VH619_18780 [Verrucomicrobiae bacterium]|nr:hypothetical protein [Verrucomicrobiae bacterium]
MKLLLIVALVISLGLAQRCVADDFYWNGGATGDFSSTTSWFNETVGVYNVGPPGGGDNADITSADLTLDGGSVMDLSGESGTLDVSGSFSATTLSGSVTVVGGGQLSVGTVTAFTEIDGGNVSANEVSSIEMEVDSGGSLTVSGSFTDHRYLECSGAGSTIAAQGGMTDIGLFLYAGGQVTTSSIENLLGSSCAFEGSGAQVTVTGNFDLAEGATLDVASNATLQVNGDLDLDGGTTIADGGATFSDPGTIVKVSDVLTIGDTKGSFYLTVDNGAKLTSGTAYIGGGGAKLGYVTVSDSNTVWTVNDTGLSVGTEGTGDLTINSGAGLNLVNNTVLGVGLSSGSSGTLTLDGAGSYIDASDAATSVGLGAGSQGTMQIQNDAAMLAGESFYVGDGGLGSLNISSGDLQVIGADTAFGIGHQTNANGSVSISGGSVVTVEGPTTVGDAGVGMLSLGGSALGTSGTTIGNTNGSTGTAYITGTNTLWYETNDFTIASGTGSKGTVYVRAQGNLEIGGDGVVGEFGNGSLYVQSGGSCAFVGGSDQDIAIGGAVAGSGLVSVSDANSLLSADAPFAVGVYGNGTVIVSNGASAQSDALGVALDSGSIGTIRITGTGSSWIAGSLDLGGDPTLQPGGAGNLLVQNSATLRVDPLFFVSPSGVVTLDSTGQIAVGTGAFGAPGTLRVSTGGKLYGSGQIQGQVDVGSGGVFIPDESPGIFTIGGNLQEEPAGEMDVFIGGDSPGSGYSQVSVSGTASLGGTLNVILANGFTPAPGQIFTILNAGAIGGTFSQVNGASVTYGSTEVTVSDVTGVKTTPPQLSIRNQGQNVVLSWPETIQGYALQTTSNLASNVWSTVTAEVNTYMAPSGTTQGFFRLIH